MRRTKNNSSLQLLLQALLNSIKIPFWDKENYPPNKEDKEELLHDRKRKGYDAAKLNLSASQQHGDRPSLQWSRCRSCPSSSPSRPSPSWGPSSTPPPPRPTCTSSLLAQLGLCQRSHCSWLPCEVDFSLSFNELQSIKLPICFQGFIKQIYDCTSYEGSRWTALRVLSPHQRDPRRGRLPLAGSPCP